jgi:hypothetical protein
VFRFVRCEYADGVAELVYAFDQGPELIERIRFPGLAPSPDREKDGGDGRGAARSDVFRAALRVLHLIAGVSYYKAGVPARIEVETGPLDEHTVDLLDALYTHGLAEFAYRNQLDLDGRIAFPRGTNPQGKRAGEPTTPGTSPRLPARTLVPIGGGKDSLVVVEALKAVGIGAGAVWVGASPLIASVSERTGLPTLNVGRQLAPALFEYNRMGAWNGHIPVTAINAAILVCAAVLYGFDAVAFANEQSASAATLEYAGGEVNHQWSKGWQFERAFAGWLRGHIPARIDCFSLLRPFSELAVARAFAKSGGAYFDAFSSCNRNFRILGPKPVDRWCGQCPKCHFVFLALAAFLPKPRLLRIFGRNLLDDEALAPGFDALIEYRQHKPFECVGEASEARAAFAALAARPEWREDALVARFHDLILPHLDAAALALEPWLAASAEHGVPPRFEPALHWVAG